MRAFDISPEPARVSRYFMNEPFVISDRFDPRPYRKIDDGDRKRHTYRKWSRLSSDYNHRNKKRKTGTLFLVCWAGTLPPVKNRLCAEGSAV